MHCKLSIDNAMSDTEINVMHCMCHSLTVFVPAKEQAYALVETTALGFTKKNRQCVLYNNVYNVVMILFV